MYCARHVVDMAESLLVSSITSKNGMVKIFCKALGVMPWASHVVVSKAYFYVSYIAPDTESQSH